MSNIEYQQDLTNKKITIGCYAKSPTSGTSFKLRIKSEDNMTNSDYTASPAFSLSTSFDHYSFEYVVPQNTTSVQAQVLMGEDIGIYFLDAFDVLVEDYTLGVNLSSLKLEFKISPNPVRDNLYLNTNHKISLVKIYDMLGHLILTQIATQSIAVESLSKGVYIVKVKFENGAILTKKFVKN